MKLYENEAAQAYHPRSCCALDDVEDARSVAHKLGIPYYVFNFTRTFRDRVIAEFANSYQNGITPNPCISCNRFLKFGKLSERAKILGCDCIATGHYARIEQRGGKYLLKKALDESKDQSYVLYFLTQQQLAYTRFPLGSLQKTAVRQLARESSFLNADKPDSQDICFVPDGDYADAVRRCLGKDPPAGNFVDAQGNILARHKGITHYTVGQRRGLGVCAPQPLYVCAIDPQSGSILLGSEQELLCSEMQAGDFHWIGGDAPRSAFCCSVRTRYRQQEQPARVTPMGNGRVKIRFEQPQRAAAPGQAAVLYDGDIVLGGGTVLPRGI